MIVGRHPARVTPRVIAFAGSQNLSPIQLVPHYSHIGQSFDLCVCGLFRMIYYRER